MFKWLSTSSEERDQQIEAIQKMVRALKIQVEAQEADLEQAKAIAKRVQGQLYAQRAKHSLPLASEVPLEFATADTREARKAAAFAKAGIIPGKPVNLEH